MTFCTSFLLLSLGLSQVCSKLQFQTFYGFIKEVPQEAAVLWGLTHSWLPMCHSQVGLSLLDIAEYTSIVTGWWWDMDWADVFCHTSVLLNQCGPVCWYSWNIFLPSLWSQTADKYGKALSWSLAEQVITFRPCVPSFSSPWWAKTLGAWWLNTKFPIVGFLWEVWFWCHFGDTFTSAPLTPSVYSCQMVLGPGN